jgi:hypothetical protein
MAKVFILNGEIVDEEVLLDYLEINPEEKGHKFTVSEELVQEVIIFGEDNEHSAADMIESLYSVGDIVLDSSDFVGEPDIQHEKEITKNEVEEED